MARASLSRSPLICAGATNPFCLSSRPTRCAVIRCQLDWCRYLHPIKKLKTPANESMPFSCLHSRESLPCGGVRRSGPSILEVTGMVRVTQVRYRRYGIDILFFVSSATRTRPGHGLCAQRLIPGRSMAAEAPPSPPKPTADADDQGPLQSEDGGTKAGDGETRTGGGGEW
jgi:hypothetical protein